MPGDAFAGAVLLVPEVLKLLGLLALALVAWKFGLPAVRILNLEQEVKLLRLELATEKATAKATELRFHELAEEHARVITELKDSNKKLAACLTVFELKTGADGTAVLKKLVEGAG